MASMQSKFFRTSAARDAALFLLTLVALVGLALGCADDLAIAGFIR